MPGRFNKDIHHRRSIRLEGYDYSSAGAYFVTVCVKDRECLFGNITNNEIALNDAGIMVRKWWMELANKFKNITTDEYMIMPNHFHGIINIVGADLCVCPDGEEANKANKGAHTGAPLHRIIQWFKTMSTNEYLRNVHKYNWQRINGKLWHRNYYERVIRNEKELYKIRQYIRGNPLNWAEDEENPMNIL